MHVRTSAQNLERCLLQNAAPGWGFARDPKRGCPLLDPDQRAPDQHGLLRCAAKTNEWNHEGFMVSPIVVESFRNRVQAW